MDLNCTPPDVRTLENQRFDWTFFPVKDRLGLAASANDWLGGLRERIEQSIQGSIQLFGRFVVAAGDFTPQLRDFVQPDFATTGDR